MTAQATTPHQRWTFLLVISLGLFVVAADNSILYTALPTLRADLHTTELEGLWIINAYPLVLAGLLLGTGTLGDKIGHRLMFLVGLTLFGLASLAAAFSPSAVLLILARAFLGAGAATMMPATLALIRITFSDVRERNIAIGIWGSVATIGAAVGPVLGGFLLEHFWWGSVFLINIPVVLVAIACTIALAPPNVADPSRKWDVISSVYAMVAMVGAVLAIKELAHSPVNAQILSAAVVVMIIGGWLFSARQKKLAEPLLAFDLFTNPMLLAGVTAAGLSMFVLAGAEILTTQRFQLAEGFSPLQAGLITAAIALAAFPSSILGGANLHRWGFRNLISGGFLLITLSAFVSVWSITIDHFGIFLASMVVAGFGVGLVMSVSSTAIIGSAPARRAGMASAVEEVSYEFGTLMSVAVLGSLFGMFYAAHAPAGAENMDEAVRSDVLGDAARNAIDSAYMSSMIIAAMVALAATVITAVLLKGNPKETDYAHE